MAEATLKAGVTHDVVIIDAAGEAHGLMLAMQQGRKLWSAGGAPVLPGRLATTEATYANFPADIDLPWSQSDWRGGMGRKELTEPNTYHYAKGMYSRTMGKLHLGPKSSNVKQVGGAVIGAGSRFMQAFGGAEYLARGSQLFKLDNTGTEATLIRTFPKPITHLFAYADWLLVAQGDDDPHWYSTDGTAWSKSAVGDTDTFAVTDATNASPIVVTTDEAHGLTTGATVTIVGVGGNTAANGTFTVTVAAPTTISLDGSTGDGAYTESGTVSVHGAKATVFAERLGTLWKASGNVLRTSTNPTVSWSGPTFVGQDTSAIIGLFTRRNVFTVQKTDGLYALDAVGHAEQIYREQPFAGPVQSGIVHNLDFFFVQRFSLIRLTAAGVMIDAGYGKLGVGSSPIIGQITQMTEDGFFLYAAFQANDGNSYVLLADPLPNGELAWDVFVETAGCHMVHVSDQYGENRRLYFANGNNLSYVILSRFHGDMLADENCHFVNRGVLFSSVTDMDFAAAQKAFDRFNVIHEGMADGLSITLRYCIDGGEWLEAGTQESAEQRDFLLGKLRNGTNVQYQVELQTEDDTQTPVIRAVVLRSRLRIETKPLFQFTVRCADDVTTLQGQSYRAGATARNFLWRLRNEANPSFLYDRYGIGWRVHVIQAQDVEVLEATGHQPEMAVQVTAVAFDDHAPGLRYGTGHTYGEQPPSYWGRLD